MSKFAFSQPRWWKTAGRLGLVAALATLVGAAFNRGLAPPMSLYLPAGALLAALLCAIPSQWVDEIEVDLPLQRYRYRRGLAPWLHEGAGGIDQISAVAVRRFEDEFGEPILERGVRVALEIPGGYIALPEDHGNGPLEEVAANLAGLLGRPLRIDNCRIEPAPPKRLGIVISASMWIAVLAVCGILLWQGLGSMKAKPRSSRRDSPVGFGFPDIPATNFQRGVALYSTAQYPKAEELFRKAVLEAPGYTEAINMLAYSEAEQGKLDLALKDAKRAVALSPTSGNYIDTLAEMHERRKEFGQAAVLYKKALRFMYSREACETHTKYGRTLVALNRPQEAIPELADAIRFPIPPWDEIARKLWIQVAANIPMPMPDPGVNMRQRNGPRAF